MTEPETNQDQQDVTLSDTPMRMVCIPLFGIMIPNATGLFGDLGFGDPLYWIGYVYFIGLSFMIWQGNRYMLFRTRKRFTWFDKPIEKLVLLFMNNIFYTTPLAIGWLCVWFNFPGSSGVKWDIIAIVTLINVICVLFVTHVYETVFMVKEQQHEHVKSAELQRAKAEAELAALKNQVDPHFMFNSLNTLTHLIQVDQVNALEFTENLADVYRYILSQKDRTFVLLDDELDFTRKYTDMLHLRFGQALEIKNNISDREGKNFLIPPTSVFVAFENAVKHNEISEQVPMHVTLDVRDNELIISNTLRQRRTPAHSSAIGLKNLDERFKLTTNRSITFGIEQDIFIVKLPLIPVTS